jgi:glycosyltransferase involved in cell wall biosynthesis
MLVHMTAVPTRSQDPTWTILVPTLGERRALFERLMTGLLPQLDPYTGRVRVVSWFNNGNPSLPKIRQTMVLGTDTDYLSFVDDDDLVSPDYVAEIMSALAGRPDYIGFQVQCYSDGHPTAVAYHSLEFTRWRNFHGRYERDISHINPIRTVLAKRADFTRTRAGRAEDREWAGQLRRARLLRSEVVIDRILYHYLFSTSRTPGEGSRWENPRSIRPGERSAIDHPYFTWSADA